MTPAERIARITRALAEARTAASEGAQVDLAGLAATVGDAMENAKDASLVQRAGLTAAMLDLLKEFDPLVAALARQHHADAQQRAAVAYAAAPARDVTKE